MADGSRANSFYEHKEVMEYLKDQGLSLHVRNNEKDNAVLLASSRGHFETLEFLVETAKQSVKVFNQYGTSPMLLATSKGHFEIVKYLVATRPISRYSYPARSYTCLTGSAEWSSRTVSMVSE
ncbi:ankyrin repeat domain-containing protein [Coxiella endosymbiont of Ornithodoros amblus]|uniref:ankyrin repeat domain-containing protein n=1 Tax=Coxiella endosymbiont of Ornithodoros amblus TaxID=1656166 RepID=UPI00244DB8BB|nr:ankyrin repeat domain-containing protein [Coxiella endosymbiont of Ornithodoros amblus]